ncbi:MAG: glycerol-3-phosphate 1-O-acyltransferase PlsY [Candidatus Krumholzibacteriota bacterium]|nr:glycerol-3-phosphate 1-O-acyltransferase PlsY [Candidatus Krumholzibacteriota bacterium]
MDLAWKIALVILPCYFLGSVPSSYIMGRVIKGIDLREHGSGNLGAANTFRVLGAKAAVPVLLFDVGKGFLAVKIVSILISGSFVYTLIAALVVVLGHNYSVFVNFSGGKGVGTTSGAFLAMAPIAVGICFLVWIMVLLIFRIVSLSSMVSALLLPVSIVISNRYLGGNTHVWVLYLSILAALLVIYKHRSNISRLFKGTENKIF